MEGMIGRDQHPLARFQRLLNDFGSLNLDVRDPLRAPQGPVAPGTKQPEQEGTQLRFPAAWRNGKRLFIHENESCGFADPEPQKAGREVTTDVEVRAQAAPLPACTMRREHRHTITQVGPDSEVTRHLAEFEIE